VETIAIWLRKNILLVAAAALGIAFVEVKNAVGWGGGSESAQGIWGAGGTGLGTVAVGWVWGSLPCLLSTLISIFPFRSWELSSPAVW
jgi:hypothetical protein